MSGKATKTFVLVGLMTLAGICVGVVVLNNAVRFNPKKWLAQHGTVAAQYAGSILNGQSPAVPDSLSDLKVESSMDLVSFGMLVGPFYSHGMAYSLSGRQPDGGLGGEPEIRKWQHVKEDWYYWVAH